MQDNMNERLIADVNENFIDFRDSLKNRSEREIREKLEIYATARKKLNKTVINNEYKRWATVIANKDSKKLWSMIDWNGKLVNIAVITQPSMRRMKDHFETLYTPEDPLERAKIKELSTEVYIPILNDPINEMEINEAQKSCKKGGYDYCLPILNILTKHFIPF